MTELTFTRSVPYLGENGDVIIPPRWRKGYRSKRAEKKEKMP